MGPSHFPRQAGFCTIAYLLENLRAIRVSCLLVDNPVEHHRHTFSLATLLFTLALLGCGGGDNSSTSTGDSGSGGGTGEVAGPPTLAEIHGPPAVFNDEPERASYAFEGYATSLASLGSFVAIGTTVGVYEPDASGGTNLMPIVGADPNLPLETGIVRATVRYEDGVLVAADGGVFFTKGTSLEPSLASSELMPLEIESMTARVADDDGDGSAETNLSIRGKNDVFELGPDKLVTWSVDGETGAPTAMFAQKDRVIIAYGHHVYEIDKPSATAYPLVFDVGFVRSIVCGSLACDEGSLLYFATDKGLVERSASGQYTRFSLAEQGAAPVAVDAFALDASKQRLYAVAGEYLLRVRAGEVPQAVAKIGASSAPRTLGVDKIGDVWMGESQTATRFALGTPLSFLTDVKPIMREYCADCHATGVMGAPPIDFEKYDVAVSLVDRIIKRAVEERSMPPGSYAKKVPADSIAILKEWVISKAP